MAWYSWIILGTLLLGVELFAVDAQFFLIFIGAGNKETVHPFGFQDGAEIGKFFGVCHKHQSIIALASLRGAAEAIQTKMDCRVAYAPRNDN